MSSPATHGKAAALSLAVAGGFASAHAVRAVTKDDYNDLPDGPADFLFVTATGNLVFRPLGWPSANSITIAVVAGQKIPFKVKRVLSTSNTATVVACYDKALEGDTDWGDMAAVLSAADGIADTATTAHGVVTSDKAGGVLYTVVTESATPPSAAQIIAGEDNQGDPAVKAANAVAVEGVNQFDHTGLTTATAYYNYFVHVDENDDRSNVAAGGLFTTP